MSIVLLHLANADERHKDVEHMCGKRGAWRTCANTGLSPSQVSIVRLHLANAAECVLNILMPALCSLGEVSPQFALRLFAPVEFAKANSYVAVVQYSHFSPAQRSRVRAQHPYACALLIGRSLATIRFAQV